MVSPVFMFLRFMSPRKSGLTSGSEGTRKHWWSCPVDFHNFSSSYVIEVEEFTVGIHTEMPCFGDLENLGQLPVHEVLGGTDDSLL